MEENDEFVDDVSNPVRSRSSDDISNIEIEAVEMVNLNSKWGTLPRMFISMLPKTVTHPLLPKMVTL